MIDEPLVETVTWVMNGDNRGREARINSNARGDVETGETSHVRKKKGLFKLLILFSESF